jgi:hypothetical protein
MKPEFKHQYHKKQKRKKEIYEIAKHHIKYSGYIAAGG